MLKLAGVQVVVVGAGKVGLRKVHALQEAGATIRLVTSQCDVQPDIPGDIEIVRESYMPDHLNDAKLVFACTNDRDVNAKIAADASKIGALVNAADQPADCDFYMPATIQDGDVFIAIGTGGSAPALAGEIKKQLLAGKPIPNRIGEFAALLAEIRNELSQADMTLDHRSMVMRKLAESEAYEIFIASGQQALRNYMQLLCENSAEDFS